MYKNVYKNNMLQISLLLKLISAAIKYDFYFEQLEKDEGIDDVIQSVLNEFNYRITKNDKMRFYVGDINFYDDFRKKNKNLLPCVGKEKIQCRINALENNSSNNNNKFLFVSTNHTYIDYEKFNRYTLCNAMVFEDIHAAGNLHEVIRNTIKKYFNRITSHELNSEKGYSVTRMSVDSMKQCDSSTKDLASEQKNSFFEDRQKYKGIAHFKKVDSANEEGENKFRFYKSIETSE